MKNKLIVVGSAITVIIASYFLLSQENEEDVFAFDIPQFAVTGTKTDTCYFKGSLYTISEKGKSVEIQTQFFKKAITMELTERGNLENTLSDFEMQAKIKCDVSSDGKNSGTTGLSVLSKSNIVLSFIVTNKAGNPINIAPISKASITTSQLCDNCGDTILATFRVPAAQFDKLFESSPVAYTEDAKFHLTADLYLKDKQGKEYKMFTSPVYSTAYFTVNKVPASTSQPTQQESTYPPIITKVYKELTKELLTGTNAKKLDTTPNSGRQITVEGTVRSWSASQGYPIVKITYCNTNNACTTNPVGIQTALTSSLTDSDKNERFVARYTMPQNSKDGIYQIELKAHGRSQVDTKKIEVKNLVGTKPAAQATTSQPTQPTQPTGIPEKLTSAKLRWVYTTIFNTETTRSNINDSPTADIQFTQLQLIKDSSGSKKFIKYILEPHIDVDDSYLKQLKPVSIDVTYSPEILLQDGQTRKLDTAQRIYKGGMTKNSATLTIPPVEVTYDHIELILRNILPENQVAGFTLRVPIKGTFTVQDETNGKLYKGAVDAAVTYFLQYDPTTEFDPSEPCQGLAGEELLKCRQSDPHNCVDFENVIGDEHCNIKEDQTGGNCKGLTPQECLNKEGTENCINIFGYDLCIPTGTDGSSSESTTNPTSGGVAPSGNSGGSITSNTEPKSEFGSLSGFCEGQTLDECLSELQNRINVTQPEIETTIIVYLVIGMILLIIIIKIIKRRR